MIWQFLKKQTKSKVFYRSERSFGILFRDLFLSNWCPDPSCTTPFVIVSGHVSETHAFGKKNCRFGRMFADFFYTTAPRSLDLAYFFFWMFSSTVELFVSFAFMQIFVLLLAHDIAASNILVDFSPQLVYLFATNILWPLFPSNPSSSLTVVLIVCTQLVLCSFKLT